MKKLSSMLLAFSAMFMVFLFAGCDVKLTLNASKTLVAPGATTQLTTTVEGATAPEDAICYEIVSGPATVSLSGLLTVNATATEGQVVKVLSSWDDLKSNTIEITVDRIALTGITLSATTNLVEQGGSVNLSAVLAPANTTQKNITYTITENETMAEILTSQQGVKRLSINADATVNSVIKVKASLGTIDSNIISITVKEASTTMRFIVSNDSQTLDKNASSQTVFTPELRSVNSIVDQTATFNFEITSGSEFVAVTPSADKKSCSFTLKGHGDATMKISCIGRAGVADKTVSIKCIVPPTEVALPEYLTNFSTKMTEADTYTVGAFSNLNNQTVPFVLSGKNSDSATYTGGVCQDFKVEFKYGNETTFVEETSKAIYDKANGAIIFKQTGNFAVKVTSKSGSATEVSATYNFVVNDLKNVYNFEQLRQAVINVESVNVIISQKPVSERKLDGTNLDTYGFDLVPSYLLSNSSWQNEAQLLNLVKNSTMDANLTTIKNSITINGNGHKVNFSYLPLITGETTSGDNNSVGALMCISPELIFNESGVLQENLLPQTESGDAADLSKLDTTIYKIKINHLALEGNFGVSGMSTNPAEWANSDYKINNKGYFTGSFNRGIQIGSESRMKNISLSMNDVSSTKFSVGMRISSTKTNTIAGVEVKSVAENIKIYNNFKAGMELCANILTIKNAEFGLNGQGPVELSPDSCMYAGNNFAGRQDVQFVNCTMTEDAISNYETPYFNYFAATSGTGATTVVQILGGAITQFIASVPEAYRAVVSTNLNALLFDNGKFGFMGLAFQNGNLSVMNSDSTDVFEAFTSEGVTALASAPTSITQKYIKLSLGAYGAVYLINLSTLN